jgi:hypothetical protein
VSIERAASAGGEQQPASALGAQHIVDHPADACACGAREKVANLEFALISSRRIGAAVGILMARHHVTYDEGFDILRSASQIGHCKVRDLAEEVILTGTVPG